MNKEQAEKYSEALRGLFDAIDDKESDKISMCHFLTELVSGEHFTPDIKSVALFDKEERAIATMGAMDEFSEFLGYMTHTRADNKEKINKEWSKREVMN